MKGLAVDAMPGDRIKRIANIVPAADLREFDKDGHIMTVAVSIFESVMQLCADVRPGVLGLASQQASPILRLLWHQEQEACAKCCRLDSIHLAIGLEARG